MIAVLCAGTIGTSNRASEYQRSTGIKSAHLDGDVDMVTVIDELPQAESKSGRDIPFRADHGHSLPQDAQRQGQPAVTR